MASGKEERYDQIKTKEPKKSGKKHVACLWSFFVSLTGGLLLAWWEYEYHPTNSQLWMVPFGLILFSTPVMIWFAILVSDVCSLTGDVKPIDGSSSVHHDTEKNLKPVI